MLRFVTSVFWVSMVRLTHVSVDACQYDYRNRRKTIMPNDNPTVFHVVYFVQQSRVK